MAVMLSIPSVANIRLASSEDAADWDAYLENHVNRTFAHRWNWSNILKKSFGTEPFYFIAERNDGFVGLLPTMLMKSRLFGTFLISLPWLDYGGPLANDDDIAAKLVHAATVKAEECGCRFLEMRAVQHRLPEMQEKTDKHEFILNLREGEEAIWKSFDAKARNQVRKAEKSSLKVQFGKAEMLDDFYKVFARNMHDLGTPVWPKSLFSEILRNFYDDTEIVLVKLDDRTICGGLLLHYQDFSAVPSASAYRQYLSLSPNNIMYWEVIKHCIKRSSKRFDFGRSSKTSGTYRFKKQWMKNPIQQIWQYKLLRIDSLPGLDPSNPKFRLAINIWRRLPLPVANFLGPKIVTKLP